METDHSPLTVIKDDHVVDEVSVLKSDLSLTEDDLANLESDELEL